MHLWLAVFTAQQILLAQSALMDIIWIQSVFASHVQLDVPSVYLHQSVRSATILTTSFLITYVIILAQIGISLIQLSQAVEHVRMIVLPVNLMAAV